MEEETLNITKVAQVSVIDKRREDKSLCFGDVEKFEIVELPEQTSHVVFHLNTGYRVSLVVKEGE